MCHDSSSTVSIFDSAGEKFSARQSESAKRLSQSHHRQRIALAIGPQIVKRALALPSVAVCERLHVVDGSRLSVRDLKITVPHPGREHRQYILERKRVSKLGVVAGVAYDRQQIEKPCRNGGKLVGSFGHRRGQRGQHASLVARVPALLSKFVLEFLRLAGLPGRSGDMPQNQGRSDDNCRDDLKNCSRYPHREAHFPDQVDGVP